MKQNMKKVDFCNLIFILDNACINIDESPNEE